MGEDRVPDHEAAVQTHVRGSFPDLDGFHSSPQPEPFGSSSDCGAFPVDAMVGLLDMNCNTRKATPNMNQRPPTSSHLPLAR